MYCRICQEWQSAKHRKKDDDGNNTRSCILTKTFPTANQFACDKFVTAETFWCNKMDHFINKKVCISSLQNSKIECKDCRIGLFVLRRERLKGRTTLVKVKLGRREDEHSRTDRDCQPVQI